MPTNRELIEERDRERRADLGLSSKPIPQAGLARLRKRVEAKMKPPTSGEKPKRKVGQRFTDEEIASVQKLVAEGHGGNAVAAIVGRNVQSVRALCARLGLSLKPVSPRNGFRFKVPDHVAEGLCAAALERHLTPSRLARMLLEVTVKLGLIDQVLDTPKPPAPKVKPAKPAKIEVEVEVEKPKPEPLPLHIALQPQLIGTVGPTFEIAISG
jgi:hypothetical protein